MADIAVQTLGTGPGADMTTQAAAGGGDSFTNDGKTYLRVKNGGGGSINVTVASPASCSHGSTHPVVVAVGAGLDRVLGPFDPNRFGNPVSVSYSGVVTVTVAAFK
jgi:hypothetical protein